MPRKRKTEMNVIDLFAGPGGLGEGFSAYRTASGRQPFRIRMSVEKDDAAHATLTLRAFLRKFPRDGWPPEYEAFREGLLDLGDLFGMYPDRAREALRESLGRPVELGSENPLVERRIREMQREAGDGPWIVIGGPPCQAYSIAGRSRNCGKADYRPERDERNFLYREYLRILARARPEVFIMENVRGMLSAVVGGRRIFHDILDDLAWPGLATGTRGAGNLGYTIYSLVADRDPDMMEPEDYLIRAENHGVPQARHRVILLGIRADLDRRPGLLTPRKRTTVGNVISKLPRIRSTISKGEDTPESWEHVIRETVRRLSGPRSGVDTGLVRFMKRQLRGLDACLPDHAGSYPRGRPAFGQVVPDDLRQWLAGNSGILAGHVARSHMKTDIARYWFASCWTLFHEGRSPRACDYPAFLAPDHANWLTGHFADRFKVQALDEPSTTITSHISKDGHYFIHPDPLQCRSLSPREAARLQTFPDDYHFVGGRTRQYHQIGNAVPPFLARQIAEIVYHLLK